MTKKFLVIVILVLIGSVAMYELGQNIFVSSDTLVLPVVNIPHKKVPDFVVMTFAGDVMMHRGVESSVNKNFGGDFNKLFEGVDIFQRDDISFVNLEGPVSDVGKKVGSIYSFRMNPIVIGVLQNLGIDIVSFANNHVGDYSSVAFKDTMDRLNTAGLPFAGAGTNYADAKTPRIIEKYGIKTCFLAFSDVGPEWIKATSESAGILLASDPNLANIIKEARPLCDVLVTSFHWGEEYKPHNARQEKLAHLAIDSGADIVVGAHPHVSQDIEIYKDKIIMYSLGNFMFDQYFSPETLQGSVVQLKAYKTGEIKDIKEYTSKQTKLFNIESIEEKAI